MRIKNCMKGCPPRSLQWQIKSILFLAMLSFISITVFFYSSSDHTFSAKFIPSSQHESCSFQTVSPWDPSIAPFITRVPPLVCSSGPPLLVYQQDGFLKVNTSKLKSRNITLAYCFYQTLVMKKGTDFESEETNFKSQLFTAQSPIQLRPNDTDVVVKCYNEKNERFSTMYLSFIIPRPSMEQTKAKMLENHVKKHEVEETLSVLIIGTDGVSRNDFTRAMPETRKYLQESLHAIDMGQYNKVGLNTFPNVVPLLTGRTRTDFLQGSTPYGKWHWGSTFDQINDAFIWSDFQKAGFRSAFAWENSKITPFHFQKLGWHKRYVDFTNRPTAVRNSYANCLYNGVATMEFYADYLEQLATVYNSSERTPYFGYVFFTILTHMEPTQASSADLIHLGILKRFKEQGLLHNTLLIYFSDHGARTGKIRRTRVGQIEANTPYAFFVFPTWFHEKYPNLIKALRVNQNRLTSPFDIYATMKDLLYFQPKNVGRRVHSKYGRSLFRELSPNRTCNDAGIPVEFCNCFEFRKKRADERITKALVDTLGKRIVELTAKFRSECHYLIVTEVKSVNKMSRLTGKSDIYLVTVVAHPGDIIFEAKVSYYRPKATRAAAVRVLGEIDRLTLYNNTADCIHDPRLKPFCFCINRSGL